MFTYKGYGCIIPIADAGGENTFLGAFNECFDQNITSMDEYDNAMILGTYESPDNIDNAEVSGYSVDYSDGIVIIETLPEAMWNARGEYPQLHEMMTMLGFHNWIEDSSIVGYYEVTCEQ